MKGAAAIAMVSFALAGCERPTGNKTFDEMFVTNYDEIVEFWRLQREADQILFPRCDTTEITTMAPDPHVRLGRRARFEAQQERAEKVAAEMSDAGMDLPVRVITGVVIDCFEGVTKLTDQEMVREMDRRLTEHLRTVEQMDQIAGTVLGRN